MATFKLDTSTLSGPNLNYVDTVFNDRGRSIQIEWVQAGANQDIRVHGFALRAQAAEAHSVEPS